MWTALVRAHADDREKFAGLIDRYQGAVYRYLKAAVSDPDRAADLFQEFALRFLRGDFRRADPDRGRFRDYLRAILINLVRRHRRKPACETVPLDADRLAAPPADAPDPDDEAFLAHWRESLLDCAWRALEAEERAGGPAHYSALRARADQPDAPSAVLAVQLTEHGRPGEAVTEAGFRKLLQRGREAFTERLVREVADSIPTRDPDRIAQELIDLGFYNFCKKALERWRA
jgi:RNA polymerase sigma-70 factor (ECF subfamily)